MSVATKDLIQDFLKRSKIYERFGYDIIKERDLIISKTEPIGKKILEVGTGKGYFTMALAAQGYHFTSVDISLEEQEFAKDNLKALGLTRKVKFGIEDACNFTFDPKSFDCIFCINTFHHIKSCFDVTSEFVRLCKENGKIVISDFNETGLKVVSDIHKKEGNIHKAFDVPWIEMKRFFNRAGFKVQMISTKNQKTLVATKETGRKS
ncbi:MAG: class I SAM-dependent methyltransferase [Candidatus Omnitrophica bacterium]|nr:class I SAM-dependent methyltransferase [Candidatus Omnitrophota bacterium]